MKGREAGNSMANHLPGAAIPWLGKAARKGLNVLCKAVCYGSLALLALIPVSELILSQFNVFVPHSRAFLIHFFLVMVFFAAMFATVSKGHVAIGLAQYVKSERIRRAIELVGVLLVVFLLTILGWNTLPYISIGLQGRTIGPVPTWIFAAAMPLGYFAMAMGFAHGLRSRGKRIAGLAVILLGTAAALPAIAKLIWGANPFDAPEVLWPWMDFLYDTAASMQVPAILLLVAAALAGMPIFAAIGGIATIMLMALGQEPEAFHIPVFDALTSQDLIAIPLFTLTGFFLSESKAGERLVRTFQAFFGRLPGGIVVVAVLISAFFSSFTGASGVTILALGGILYAVFQKNGYRDRAAMGLVTAAGGTGVMFPPSLAIILVFSSSSMILHFMNVPAQHTVIHYFAGAFIPGVILLAATIAVGALLASKSKAAERTSASQTTAASQTTSSPKVGPREAFAALRASFLEILLPLLLVAGFFTGRLTLLQASAVSVVYVVIVEVFIKRDIPLRELHKIFAKAIPVVGSVLVILAMASGLSYAFVFSGVPEAFTTWMTGAIREPVVFLLLLNGALLLVGSVVDMFSAIFVLLPLVVPLGYEYGIHPVHLGVIFILNLEAGFLTPPVGINLFLASSRFGLPFMRICSYAIPFFLVRLLVLLLVSYIPWFSTWLPELLRGMGL